MGGVSEGRFRKGFLSKMTLEKAFQRQEGQGDRKGGIIFLKCIGQGNKPRLDHGEPGTEG